jgi:hypothetical protein
MMKFAPIFILCILLLSNAAKAQIPNQGFENWVTDADSNLNPVGWETTNSYPLVNVAPVSPGFQGNYAMRVRTIDAGLAFPGIAMLHTAIPFGGRPTQFTATFRSTTVGGDIAYIIIGLMKGDSVVASVDSCTFKVDSSFSQFTTRHFRIAYQSNLVPDSMVIIISSGLAFGHVGTELIVDEISFSGVSAIDVPEVTTIPRAFGLSQNFPNPFNPTTTIRYSLARRSQVTLAVFNIVGERVATLVNEMQEPGTHDARFDASGLASGTYFYRLLAGAYAETRKLVVMK